MTQRQNTLNNNTPLGFHDDTTCRCTKTCACLLSQQMPRFLLVSYNIKDVWQFKQRVGYKKAFKNLIQKNLGSHDASIQLVPTLKQKDIQQYTNTKYELHHPHSYNQDMHWTQHSFQIPLEKKIVCSGICNWFCSLFGTIYHGHQKESVNPCLPLVHKLLQPQLLRDLRADLKEGCEEAH